MQVGVWEMVRLKGRRSVELAGKLWAVGMGVGMGLCMVGAWRAALCRGYCETAIRTSELDALCVAWCESPARVMSALRTAAVVVGVISHRCQRVKQI